MIVADITAGFFVELSNDSISDNSSPVSKKNKEPNSGTSLF